jgi:myo-inositol-1(or 4)-monophosphatase
MNYKLELNTAKLAAKEAAKIIYDYSLNKTYGIKLKGKNDLITDADLDSEKKIIDTIKLSFPKDKFLAEESNGYTSLPDGRIWIIDPIDGTTNFAHNFAPYCVSIALWVDGIPKVGVVLEVTHNELFWAVEGAGSWLYDRQIYHSETTDPAMSLIATGFPYTKFKLVDKYLDVLKTLMQNTHGIRRAGAASYDLCCVAAGRVEGFFEYGLSPWDVAAGSLIIKEAGGMVCDWKGKNNWLFGKRIIAGNKQVVEFLKKEISNSFGKENLKL